MQNQHTEELARQYGAGGDWRFALLRRVRWGDVDGFGHVNHLAYLGWFEDVRNAYMSDCGFPLSGADTPGPVIKETACVYHRPLRHEDEILVTARTTSFRQNGFRMDYAVWRNGIVATGHAICVWMLNESGQKCSLPDKLRQRFIDQDAAADETTLAKGAAG